MSEGFALNLSNINTETNYCDKVHIFQSKDLIIIIKQVSKIASAKNQLYVIHNIAIIVCLNNTFLKCKILGKLQIF